MINYIRAELYRLAHKKSIYYYYGGLTLSFFVLLFFGDAMNLENYVEILTYMIPVIIMFVTVQAYMAVYTDDLSAHTLSGSLSTGLSRAQLVIAKIIVSVLYLLIVFAILTSCYLAVYLIIGGRFAVQDMEVFKYVLNVAIVLTLSSLAYMTLSSIVNYGLQTSALSIIVYVLLTMGFIYELGTLLTMALPVLEPFMKYTITETQNSAMAAYSSSGALPVEFYVTMLAYVVVTTVLAVAAFKKREVTI